MQHHQQQLNPLSGHMISHPHQQHSLHNLAAVTATTNGATPTNGFNMSQHQHQVLLQHQQQTNSSPSHHQLQIQQAQDSSCTNTIQIQLPQQQPINQHHGNDNHQNSAQQHSQNPHSLPNQDNPNQNSGRPMNNQNQNPNSHQNHHHHHHHHHSQASSAGLKKELPANGKKTKGRVRIKMEFIHNKLRRYTTFSKRKTGIMKKAFELATLTGTQVMLLVASETGHVYTFATRKLQPMIISDAGKALIQTCLNSPDSDNINTSSIHNNNSNNSSHHNQHNNNNNNTLNGNSNMNMNIDHDNHHLMINDIDELSSFNNLESSILDRPSSQASSLGHGGDSSAGSTSNLVMELGPGSQLMLDSPGSSSQAAGQEQPQQQHLAMATNGNTSWPPPNGASSSSSSSANHESQSASAIQLQQHSISTLDLSAIDPLRLGAPPGGDSFQVEAANQAPRGTNKDQDSANLLLARPRPNSSARKRKVPAAESTCNKNNKDLQQTTKDQASSHWNASKTIYNQLYTEPKKQQHQQQSQLIKTNTNQNNNNNNNSYIYNNQNIHLGASTTNSSSTSSLGSSAFSSGLASLGPDGMSHQQQQMTAHNHQHHQHQHQNSNQQNLASTTTSESLVASQQHGHNHNQVEHHHHNHNDDCGLFVEYQNNRNSLNGTSLEELHSLNLSNVCDSETLEEQISMLSSDDRFYLEVDQLPNNKFI